VRQGRRQAQDQGLVCYYVQMKYFVRFRSY
jgi:hypothetical protein